MDELAARFHVVTGKGGVGKSTLAAALALRLSRGGRRVLVCEVGARERVAAMFGQPPSGAQIHLVSGTIETLHMRPADAMREYGLMVLRFRAVYNAVFENKFVRYFVRAIPSLAEIVLLGKIWWHVCEERDASGKLRWDHVVLDAPATGHAVALLRTPADILDIVSEGPMLRDMRAMHAMVTDPAMTRVHVVALPEEMPATEATELVRTLRDDVKAHIGLLILNAATPGRFSAEERALLGGSTAEPLGPARIALSDFGRRQDRTTLYRERLRVDTASAVTEIPLLFADPIGEPELALIASLLGAAA